MECPNCDGDGYIPNADDEEAHLRPEISMIPCQTCGGTGEVREWRLRRVMEVDEC